MWAALAGAGPWAAFLAVCALIAYGYQRDWIISAARYRRRESEQEANLAAERRIADYHEKRADKEADRADRAQDALTRLVAELPDALRQVKAGGS